MSTGNRAHSRLARRGKEEAEIKSLEEKTANPDNYREAKFFDDLPMSKKTCDGLKQASFRELTEIQRKAIPMALAKKDVLGAAKTGSGKTLAFLVPMLDILYRARWNPSDGLGALIISPTRELAVQIFEVLKKIGRQHVFSAGLIIGGKNFKVEKDRICRMNILVATPGRLLQHMDQSAGFNCDNLQLLVLDEADRILDMGFEREVNAIIDNLPRSRQTLLFSATQTRSVKDLARLSLKDAEYVAVHEKSEHSTPQKLSQHYIVCNLPKKLDILYSFIRTHLKSKIIVFMSSCKQARFTYECFCKLQPGTSVLHLHGKQKQTKRVEIFRKFTSTLHSVLLCTDIAARGLDFPAVDWVIQLDCPEDADTYIHRVGRTARFDAEGHALLLLLPSEKDGMLEELKKKRVPIEAINVRADKQESIQKKLQNLCFKNADIKYLGQKAFVAYMRSVYLQRDKNVFKVTELPADDYAHSLGLAGTPKIKFVKRAEAKAAAATAAKDSASTDEEESEDDEMDEEPKTKTKTAKTKHERLMQRKNQDILSEHYSKLVDFGSSNADEEEDEFITLHRVDHDLDEPESESEMKDLQKSNMSKRVQNMGKKERAKRIPKGERIVFDEEGNAHPLYELVDETEFHKAGDAKSQIAAFINEEGEAMKAVDMDDKELAKQKRREKKLLRKQREEEARRRPMDASEESDDDHDQMDVDDNEQGEAPSTRKRHWLETASSDEDEKPSKSSKVLEIDQPVTLQDQEALALQLLGH